MGESNHSRKKLGDFISLLFIYRVMEVSFFFFSNFSFSFFVHVEFPLLFQCFSFSKSVHTYMYVINYVYYQLQYKFLFSLQYLKKKYYIY